MTAFFKEQSMDSVSIAIPQMGNGLFRNYMKRKYVTALKQAGASVKWIELNHPDAAISKMFSCDGLLLPGGGDMDPSIYNQPMHEKCGIPNPVRDSLEPILFKAFLPTKRPILGICRGIQVMNVALGGTLIQDISDKQIYPHSDFPNRGNYTHPVRISEDTRLYKIMKTKMIMVNSMHHQVVDELGEKLKINAISPDGYIEGIELKDHPFCIGVQWHPEHMVKYSSFQKDLFSEFVQTCKK